ncbi:MAG TPA: YqgE/AlgH family protein [Anseongella sp.]
MIGELRPEAGRLLLAEPFMLDPNFRRSVVYLTEYNDLGAVGFVLNQPSILTLKDIIEDINEDFPVYIGGPVENNTLHFLHLSGDRIDESREVSEGIYWGGNFETIKVLLENKYLTNQDIRFFIGYSGWSPGQLEDEMEENAWLVAGSRREFLFHPDPDTLWTSVVKSMGKKYEHMVHFPQDPNMN